MDEKGTPIRGTKEFKPGAEPAATNGKLTEDGRGAENARHFERKNKV